MTLIADSGRELCNQEIIVAELNADFYFAQPFCSWERGANGNSNGLASQYSPKGSDFTAITNKDLRHVERRLSNRLRKCLDMKTSNQVAFGLHPIDALGI